ncbi:CASP-like protein 1U2 [Dichanthelium oligosanthes]|uniref:CASP-like protein n=1 Tax=Dichanthelium oligosanthes TaxID=888268 RepID=A0A1E5UVZ2_9POAL|nr:CASP-like protein 1U2 [Dichanthelium oligosanthes]
MYGSSCQGCHGIDAAPNGSKAVTLLLRLCTLALAIASAVVMATASGCTIYGVDGAAATVTYKDYPPFVYLVGCNITATILEVAAVYLQLGKSDDEEEAPVLPRVVLVVLDVAVQVLLYSATGAVFAAVTAYGAQISACAGAAGHFCAQVHKAKLICFGACFSAALAAIAKDVQLPFSVWPIASG